MPLILRAACQVCSLEPAGYQEAQRVLDPSGRQGSQGTKARPDQPTVLALNRGKVDCLAHVVELYEAIMTSAGDKCGMVLSTLVPVVVRVSMQAGLLVCWHREPFAACLVCLLKLDSAS